MPFEFRLASGHSVVVDEEDRHLVEQYAWCLHRTRKIDYVLARVVSEGRRTSVYLHRLITGAKRGQLVDHVNHNGLDNRRGNLRICTPSQNCGNARLSSRNKSGYKGVHWRKDRARWVAQMGDLGALRRLGSFTSPVDAAKAYDRAAREKWGEFALVNFPEDFI